MKYLITSCQKGVGVNKNFLRNILLFAKTHSVDKILVIPMAGKYKDEEKIDPRLQMDEFELVDNVKLNNNLRVYDTKILPQQIDPFSGMNSKL